MILISALKTWKGDWSQQVVSPYEIKDFKCILCHIFFFNQIMPHIHNSCYGVTLQQYMHNVGLHFYVHFTAPPVPIKIFKLAKPQFLFVVYFYWNVTYGLKISHCSLYDFYNDIMCLR